MLNRLLFLLPLLLKSTEGISQQVPTIVGPSKEMIQMQRFREESKLDTYAFLTLLDSITHHIKDRADYEFYYTSFELAQYKFRNKIDTADRMAVEIPDAPNKTVPILSCKYRRVFL